jgi:hypothetical protein
MKNLLTREAFAEFCDKQPADEKYNWYDEAKCAAAQYAESLGMWEDVWLKRHAHPSGRRQFWRDMSRVALQCPEHTFGRLARYIRERS